MLDATQLPVVAALRFHEDGAGFALPIVQHPTSSDLQAVQVIDEPRKVVAGFRALEGDTTRAIAISNGPVSVVGRPQIYAFVAEDQTIYVGVSGQSIERTELIERARVF